MIAAARLAGMDAREASAFGERLVRSGILRDTRPLGFQHALVLDAVMSGMTASEGAQLHAAAARLLG
jgi:hypothetical protein